jgi:subtilase family protein
MKTRWIRRLVVGILALSVAAVPGMATTPTGGAVDPSSPLITWTGSFATGGANAAGACAAPSGALGPAGMTPVAACDIFELDVNVPAGYWDGKTGGVTVTIDQFGAANIDLAVWVRTATGGFGTRVGTSTKPAGAAEIFEIAKAQGPYLVGAIATMADPGTTYQASAGLASAPLPDPGPYTDIGPQVVLALIDSGINPYHVAFRDTSPVAAKHPATYIPGYPPDAVALNLSLNAPDLATALTLDAAVWTNVKRGVLYYVPGTRIVGWISVGSGATRCGSPDFFPVNTVNSLRCPDRILLDDHGHGTMTASRAAAAMDGNIHSLGNQARIVEIEGLGGAGVRWAADQGWIDVSSNSWANLVPFPATGLIDNTYADIHYAASRTLTFFASGNGAGGALGVTPHPSYLLATAPPGVIVVGAHDNGKVTFWSGSPPHVLADGYGGYMAAKDSMTAYGPDSVACCTSAAAPYAAGGAARLILAARQMLGSSQVGIHSGVVATGTPKASGPLADGELTLDEVRNVLFHTAEAPVAEDRDDGLLQWMGEPRLPDQLDRGPGANPYCNGCQTLPIGWTEVPAGTPSHLLTGYGAINWRSTEIGIAVLGGTVAEPVRPEVDAFYALDQEIRQQLAAFE